MQKPETLEAIEPESQADPSTTSGEPTPQSPPEAINVNTGDPMELAAMGFDLYYPKFRIGIHTLSKKELVRLVLNLVEKPLLDDTPIMSSERGKTVLAMGEHLLECKWLMKNHMLFDLMNKVEPNEQISDKEPESIKTWFEQPVQEDKKEGNENGET